MTALSFTTALLCKAQEPASAAAPATGSTSQEQQSEASLDEGQKYLKNNQPDKALAVFEKLLVTDPDNATANLLAAGAALNMFRGDLAVMYAQKTRQLAPDDWRVEPTLITAYAQAGMAKERDAERAKVIALESGPNAPEGIKVPGFLLDLFKVKDYRVEVVQYFKPVGKFHTYYRF